MQTAVNVIAIRYNTLIIFMIFIHLFRIIQSFFNVYYFIAGNNKLHI